MFILLMRSLLPEHLQVWFPLHLLMVKLSVTALADPSQNPCKIGMRWILKNWLKHHERYPNCHVVRPAEYFHRHDAFIRKSLRHGYHWWTILCSLFGLFCLKGDKELHRLVKKLSGQFSKLIVTTDQDGLLLSAAELSEKLISVGINNESVESVSSGIAQLRELIKDAGVGLIFGSHYIAEEVFSESEISFDPGVI